LTLAETQALFWSLVTREPGAPRERIESAFAGTPAFPADERVDVYANMYYWRILDALREDFSQLVKLLGEDLFQKLIRDYLRRNASEHPSLGYVGRHFPRFLRERGEEFSRSDVADLAELEWSRARVFEDAAAPSISATAVKNILPQDFAFATVRLIPALRLIDLEHDVASVWRRLENDEEPGDPTCVATHIVVWRPEFEVLHSVVEADEAEGVRLALEGRTFAEVCEAFAARASPVEAAFNAIGSWFTEGMIAAVERPGPGSK
jgi:hypothetical protein